SLGTTNHIELLFRIHWLTTLGCGDNNRRAADYAHLQGAATLSVLSPPASAKARSHEPATTSVSVRHGGRVGGVGLRRRRSVASAAVASFGGSSGGAYHSAIRSPYRHAGHDGSR